MLRLVRKLPISEVVDALKYQVGFTALGGAVGMGVGVLTAPVVGSRALIEADPKTTSVEKVKLAAKSIGTAISEDAKLGLGAGFAVGSGAKALYPIASTLGKFGVYALGVTGAVVADRCLSQPKEESKPGL